MRSRSSPSLSRSPRFERRRSSRPSCPITTWRRSGRRRRSEAGVRHERHAALARDERSVLVRLPDARGTAVLHRRSDEEDQGAALRSREDGRHAHLDHPHPVRRAAPAVLDRAVREERHRLRVRRAGAGRREHRDAAEAGAPPSRSAAAPATKSPAAARRRRAIRSSGPASGGRRGAPAARRATARSHFEYDLATARLTLLEDYKEEPRPPRWAAMSPDEKTIVFARNHNLFMMDADNYAKALKKADDPTIVEAQLTTDGVEHYSYGRTAREILQPARAGATAATATAARRRATRSRSSRTNERDGRPRTRACRPINIIWSRDSNKFALVRRDSRKVKDLWVINALATPRPTLETYRYAMPGKRTFLSRKSTSSIGPPNSASRQGRPLRRSDGVRSPRCRSATTSSAIRGGRLRRSGSATPPASSISPA